MKSNAMPAKNKLIVILLLLLITTSCAKETVIEECKLRKVTTVTIKEMPSGLDLFSNPDLRCDITQQNSSYWSYPSFSADNVSGLPITLSFQTEVLMSKEMWSVRILDEDIGEADLVFTADFEPYSSTEGNSINFYDGSVNVFSLNYYEVE